MNRCKRLLSIVLAVMLILAWVPGPGSQAEEEETNTKKKGDVTIVAPDDREYIYVDEEYAIEAKIEGLPNARITSFISTDADQNFISFIRNGNKITLTGIQPTLENKPIVFTATYKMNDNDIRSAEYKMIVRKNKIYYITDSEGRNNAIDGGNEAKLSNTMLVNDKMSVSTNLHVKNGEKKGIAISGNAGYIAWSQGKDTYTYDITALEVSNTNTVTLTADPYTYVDEYNYKRKLTPVFRIQVIDGLTLSSSSFSMYKGTDKDNPGVWTQLKAYSASDETITWSVTYQTNSGSSLKEIEAEKTEMAKYFTFETKNNSKAPIIKVSSDLKLSGEKNSEFRKYTIHAQQTVNGVIREATCTVTIMQPVTGVTISGFASESEKTNLVLHLKPATDYAKTITASANGSLIAGDTMAPDNADIRWSCTNDEVLSIMPDKNSKTITIKALKPGTANIIAVSTDDPSKMDHVFVTVRPKVTGVEITNGNSLSVDMSKSAVQLFSNVTSDAVDNVNVFQKDVNSEVRWKASNPKVLDVNETTGLVKLLAPGNTSVICTSVDNPLVQAVINISVNVPVMDIKLDDYQIKIGVGETFYSTMTLQSSIEGTPPTNQKVTWESSDTNVATVDNKGMITGIAGGKCSVLVRAEDGEVTATCEVEVYEPVSRVELNRSKMDLNLGEEAVLEADVFPRTATNQTVTWVSDNPSSVSVSPEGLIVGKAPGDPVAITAYIVDEKGREISSTCVVTVTVPITSLELSCHEKEMRKNEVFTLSATIEPANATIRSVTFDTTNAAVATINSAGEVTAVGGGSCYITCTSKNRDMVSVCYVTVKENVKSVSLNKQTLNLKKGKKSQLKATVSKSTATEKGVTWTSSNKKVATVSQKGVVTAKAYGSATIKCKAVDGSGKYAVCKVTVKRMASKLVLNKNKVKIKKGSSVSLKATVLPQNTTNKNLSWSAKDKKIATVSKQGKVTAKKTGTTYITVKTTDGSNLTRKCKVTVVRK